MIQPMLPLLLLADSNPLFCHIDRKPVLVYFFAEYDCFPENAAYVGAANGDEPAYFEIFEAAALRLGCRRVHMISSSFELRDRKHLAESDWICLAGGDPLLGWDRMNRAGMLPVLQEARTRGAIVMGVSAGAVQMGLMRGRAEANGAGSPDERERHSVGFGWLPWLIDAHQEERDWSRLRGAHRALGGRHAAFGVPWRSVAVAEPDRLPRWLYGGTNHLWLPREGSGPVSTGDAEEGTEPSRP
ncbi:Type 1 glutamine amidotransferase-like domain-containing protein [Sulfidibacter corallicola]|uniref:Type 1 glutamine amidotransferase-like domain-containing protein n=2 Tax=Sulfidibacter corallicola TaxID=2818388 RepID=A0A8A4TQQ2_SULCO|nr:Type 1 glutamine amidotransferase-like domain-containing protein [Sulfidibacter corallicola]